ncbi:diguanylate cyclase [Actinoplanes sp. NPDC026670]|uniref:diguanylate cyclase domain-containing protein n=1 Tax=Actinoplanes sp. NPDC026670 TaxID=3154700 RepID=UPI0033E392A2
MPLSLRRLRLLEASLGVASLTALHAFGLAVPGNIWHFNAFLIIGTVVVTALANARPGLPAIALQLALTAAVLYLTGWGPVMTFDFVIVGWLVCDDFARRWRSVVALVMVAIAAGQAAVWAGLAPSYLDNRSAQLAGLVGAAAVLTAMVLIGREAQARAEAELDRSTNEERFRAVLQDSHDVTVITDAEGTPVFVSSAVERVMGVTVEQHIAGRAELVHPDDAEITETMFKELLAGRREQVAEARLRHADGSWRWHEISARNLLDNPAVRGLVFNHRDITARKTYQEKLAYEATHDALTGLANLAALRTGLTSWCSGESYSALGAVLYLDLDGFKQVNDQLGHAAGDELLEFTARTLRACVLGSDLVARLGGDEFAVLLTEINDPRDAITVAERIIDRLAEPEPLAGHMLRVRASVGIAVSRPGEHGTAELLRQADAAMYEAKRAGSHGWRLHSMAG